MGPRLPSVLAGEDSQYERDMLSYGLSPKTRRVVTKREAEGRICGCAQDFSPCAPCRREQREAEEAAALERLREIGALR